MYEEFKDRNFVIVSVAFDTGGPDAVREFIRPASPIDVPAPMRAIMSWTPEQYAAAGTPTYPCLIDEKHVVARAYDMRNVPMAVWIDERGRIVRPAEAAGATDGFRKMDRTTFALADDVVAAGRAARARYVAAIRDWVENGDRSRYVLGPDEVRARVAGPSDADARGAAAFRLGQFLYERGDAERANRWFDEAKRLCPERWTFFRQALHLREKGLASGPEFFAAVRALGDRPYYPEPVL